MMRPTLPPSDSVLAGTGDGPAAADATATGGSFRVLRSTTPRTAERRTELLQDPGWGRVFTDHMVTLAYEPGRGWHDGAVRAFEPLEFYPSTSVFHYGQAIFEGLKAYHRPDGSVAVFRPERNARRFAASARRLAMPELPEELFLESLRALVAQDRNWVPQRSGHSLYLRPLEIATDAELMTRPSRTYLYTLFASPVASYFEHGVQPVTVWLNTDYPRAAPGGTGAAKFAGNYAGGMLGHALAVENGCDQVVWLDSREYRYIEEMGGMNIFFVLSDGRLVTPELTGTILPGVTRDSILALGRDLGLTVEERRISIDEWRDGAADGTVVEAFACGTAAVVTPIGQVKSSTGSFAVADGRPGPVTVQLFDRLLGIQQGTVPDPHGWMVPLVEGDPH